LYVNIRIVTRRHHQRSFSAGILFTKFCQLWDYPPYYRLPHFYNTCATALESS